MCLKLPSLHILITSLARVNVKLNANYVSVMCYILNCNGYKKKSP